MKQFNLTTGLLVSALALSACGQQPSQSSSEETCTQANCSEKTINAPVPTTPTTTPPSAPEKNPPAPSADYRFPGFNPDWKLSRAAYENMVRYYNSNLAAIPNQRYAIIIDFNQPSTRKRLYLFDLKAGSVEAHATAHGKNSDPDNDTYATLFSNTPDSLQSSLGFYLTLATYNGSHGYSLRLRGLEATNSNAEARDIVMHPADYVSDAKSTAGRSWGCPAIDPAISKGVIDKVKNGALLLIHYDSSESRK